MSRNNINLEPLETFLGIYKAEKDGSKMILDHSRLHDYYSEFWHIRYCIFLLKSSRYNVLSRDSEVKESIQKLFLSKAGHLLQGCLYYADFCEEVIKLCGGDTADEKKQSSLTVVEEGSIPFEERGDESPQEIVDILQNYHKVLVDLKSFLERILSKKSQAKREFVPNLAAYLWKLKRVYDEIRNWKKEIKNILDLKDLLAAMRNVDSTFLREKCAKLSKQDLQTLQKMLDAISTRQKFILKYLQIMARINIQAEDDIMPTLPKGASLIIRPGDKFDVGKNLNSQSYRELKSKFLHHALYIRSILFGLEQPIAVARISYLTAQKEGFKGFALFMNVDLIEKFENEVRTDLNLMNLKLDCDLLPTTDMKNEDIERKSIFLATRAKAKNDTFTELCVNINHYTLLLSRNFNVVENLTKLSSDLKNLIALCEKGNDINIVKHPLFKIKGRATISDPKETEKNKIKLLEAKNEREASTKPLYNNTLSIETVIRNLSDAEKAISKVLKQIDISPPSRGSVLSVLDASSTPSNSSSSSSSSITSISSSSTSSSTSSTDNPSHRRKKIKPNRHRFPASSSSSSSSSVAVTSSSAIVPTRDWSQVTPNSSKIKRPLLKRADEDSDDDDEQSVSTLPLSVTNALNSLSIATQSSTSVSSTTSQGKDDSMIISQKK